MRKQLLGYDVHWEEDRAFCGQNVKSSSAGITSHQWSPMLQGSCLKHGPIALSHFSSWQNVSHIDSFLTWGPFCKVIFMWNGQPICHSKNSQLGAKTVGDLSWRQLATILSSSLLQNLMTSCGFQPIFWWVSTPSFVALNLFLVDFPTTLAGSKHFEPDSSRVSIL